MSKEKAGSTDTDENPYALSQRELRKLYLLDGEDRRRKSARQGLWAAVGVYLLFSIPDLLLIPDVADKTIPARFAIGLLVLLAMEVLFRLSARTLWLDLTCAAAIIFGYAFWLLPAMSTALTETLSYYMIFGAIFMMGANLFFSFQFRLSVVSSIIVMGIFFLALFHFPASGSYQLTLGIFYVSCFTFTSYVNWKLNRERFQVFINAQEARSQHREATERGKALLRLSRTDSLTGLENRRAIDGRLRDHWAAWREHGHTFAALLIDVDFFKRYNDCYGHQEGDRCLILVADALAKTVKGHVASIGRYGGEEFIVIARLDAEQKVADLAEKMRSTVEALAIGHKQRRDGVPVVTVSIGAALARHQGGRLENLIYEADRALYLAKANGRNCVRLFDPDEQQDGDENENIAALLKIAIEKQLVSLVYQPIRGARSGHVEAFEALMRISMLDGMPISPSAFVPVAERTGTILELGQWVIRTVCHELTLNEHIGVVSINVSPIQLKARGFAAFVASTLGRTGVAGNRLAFEITEGLEMELHSDVLRCIADLKLLGIQIWLDDFGTGFAGLSWLRRIDFDTVKIDQSFLHDCTSPRGRSMLQDIVRLLRNRGPNILVEGVENEDQMSLARELGIDLVQGFHVGRPTTHVENARTVSFATSHQLVTQKSA